MVWFKRKKTSSKNSEINIEQFFLDQVFKAKENIIADKKLEVPLKSRNCFLLTLFGFCVIAVLIFFSLNLQIIHGQAYDILSQKNKYISFRIHAERGIIYDSNMSALVKNEVSFDLCFQPISIGELNPPDQIIDEVASIVSQNPGEIKNNISAIQEGQEVLLKKDLTHQELVSLEIKLQELGGFKVVKRVLRQYENNSSLGHILGYLGKISLDEYKESLDEYDFDDYLGRVGLEKQYEDVLREKKGQVLVERNVQGKEVSTKQTVYPVSGDNIVLFLDLGLQKKAKESLEKVMQEIGSNRGIVVALDPKTGGILASVSLPDFDNNLFAKGISPDELNKINNDPLHPLLNRVIAGLYPTGSTIKPIVASAALEEKIIDPSEKIYCPSDLCIENKYDKDADAQCFGDWKFHGWTDIRRALAESINPFFYMMGGGYTAPSVSSKYYDPNLPKKLVGLGANKLVQYFELFGLGKETGIDLAGEAEGQVPSPEWKQAHFKDALQQQWYLGDTYNLSIGQGFLLATPIQMAVAYSVVANGGKLLEPHYVKSVVDTQTGKTDEIPLKIVKENIVSPETLAIVQEGMRQCVSSPTGSAVSLNSLPVKVAGKTGTAQTSEDELYQNWIGVYGPIEDPQIVLMVLIEDVQGLRVAAQKVAKEILEYYFTK